MKTYQRWRTPLIAIITAISLMMGTPVFATTAALVGYDILNFTNGGQNVVGQNLNGADFSVTLTSAYGYDTQAVITTDEVIQTTQATQVNENDRLVADTLLTAEQQIEILGGGLLASIETGGVGSSVDYTGENWRMPLPA